MADKKISALTVASTPLAGTEVLPIVQSNTTVKVSVANLTAGRAVATSGITNTGNADLGAQADGVTAGGYGTRFSGASVTNNGVDWYSSYGRAIWNANSAATGGARRFAIVNGINYTNFGIIRSVDASTDPALNGNGGTVSSGTLDWSLDTSGNITNHTGNLIVGTAAKGVNFTANSAAAGMTSQLLNWYEEGTWTPTLLFGGGNNCTYSIQTGDYTRIGRQVTLTCTIALSAVGGSTGVATISGFPFTSKASIPTIALWQGDSITFTGSYPFIYQSGSATTCALFAGDNTATFTQLTNANFSNTSTLRFVLTYNV